MKLFFNANKTKNDKSGIIWFKGEYSSEDMEKETFETLWEYCTSNNRLCLGLSKWHDFYPLLKNTKDLSGHGGHREPADVEVICHNWGHVMPIELQFQFKACIEWASDNNQIEEVGKYLRSLLETDWAHYGEI